MISQTMDTEQMFFDLLEHLGYKSSPYLISTETPNDKIPAELETTWREAKDKLEIDAIYFIANAPVIYFKRFPVPDRKLLAQLHRNVWSQSKIPLIFIILPTEIRIYSGYETPHRDRQKAEITEPSRLEKKLVSSSQQASSNIWERLNTFSRMAIESGSFWREHSDSKYFRRAARADQKLITNLRYIRCELVDDISLQLVKYHGLDRERDQQQISEISSKYANNLIGRSIFALYLQDRDVLSDENGIFFSQRFDPNYRVYTDLLASYEHAYNFFQFLQDRFNGDIFPIDEMEKEVVRPENLEKLRRLFTEDAVGTKGHRQMLFFWAYNFEFVPIELISSIYEEFLHEEEDGKDGTYYTPPRLVDFMLDQLLPENDTNYSLRILDPACGSGIFLVEAYRRLVERWRRVHKKSPSFPELVTILQSSIFGVDIKAEALSVASFSLCLAMSDYLEPKTIWMTVKFPSLIKDRNLINADFFEKRLNPLERTFDLVVGNPPWESSLTEHAKTYLTEHGYDVGDEQIAQAFLWHAPDFCTLDGQIALLCSSKHLLFNRSGPNILFRQKFFRQFAITQIFDFSALRRFLFEKAIAPTTAIFYKPQHPDLSETIFYGAPKLTHLTRRFAALVIETNDLKYLPLQQVLESIDNLGIESDDVESDVTDLEQQKLFSEEEAGTITKRAINIWKIALWGTSYDYILLQQLGHFPTLGQAIKEKGWPPLKVGFNHRGPGKLLPAPWLDNKHHCTPKDFRRYGIDVNTLQRLPEGDVYYRRGKAEQFQAPFVLFKRTQVQREIGAAYFDQDCAYSETFTCIAGAEGDRNLLKATTALLNSELAQYYLFLTSASWGVEREEIKAGELRALPFPFLDATDVQIDTIAYLVDELAQHDSTLQNKDKDKIEAELNRQIYACFHLNDQEKQHIHETIEYTIQFFHKPETSLALKEPSSLEMEKTYAQSYMQSLNFYLEMVDRKLTSTVYAHVQEKLPLLAVKFSLNMLDAKIADIQEEMPDDEMRQVLSNLSELSTEQVSGRMYHRRNFKIYENDDEDTLYMVKPAECRYWTIGAALSDAEETLADLM